MVEPLDDLDVEAIEAAALWYDRHAMLKSPVAKLAAASRRMFARQERELAKALGKRLANRLGSEASAAAVVEAIESLEERDVMIELEIVLEETEGMIRGEAQAAGAQAAGAGASVVLEQLDVKTTFTFNRDQARVIEHLEARAARLVTRVSDTTRRRIRSAITGEIKAGRGIDDVGKVIRSSFRDMRTPKPQRHIRDRAELIAVTELGEAFEYGGKTVSNDLQRGGLPIEKRWFDSGDDRVSEGCLENSAAGWIPEAEAFPSGHDHPLRFPGCRCTTQRRLAKDAV